MYEIQVLIDNEWATIHGPFSSKLAKLVLHIITSRNNYPRPHRIKILNCEKREKIDWAKEGF